MAKYTIFYLDGVTEEVTADGVEYDADASDYTFFVNGQAVALAPVNNIRSVHRHSEKAVTG